MPIGPARMSLMEHLGELRMRLVRVIVCLIVAIIVFYLATPTVANFLRFPSPILCLRQRMARLPLTFWARSMRFLFA